MGHPVLGAASPIRSVAFELRNLKVLSVRHRREHLIFRANCARKEMIRGVGENAVKKLRIHAVGQNMAITTQHEFAQNFLWACKETPLSCKQPIYESTIPKSSDRY